MNASEAYMSEALAEARKGWGRTNPNPMVGAVIVEDGVIVSRGFHAKAGGPHAEIEALNKLGRKPRDNATMYVTLEPCCTTGKTGPCTEAIKAAGIRNVFIGAIDPDQRHQGRGIDILRSAGVEAVSGILKDECEDLNLIFNHVSTRGAPLIAGKTATTLDGKVATRAGSSRWITGESARADVMRWRRYFPAIAVGSGTVLADDPSLTSRLEDSVDCGVRFVFDRRLRTRAALDDLQVYNDAFKDNTIVVTNSNAAGLSEFENKGIQVWQLGGTGLGFWESFKRRCMETSIHGIYCEGGPVLLNDLLAHHQLDYLFAYRAPKFLADSEAPTFISGQVIENMNAAFELKQVRHAIFGIDQLTRGFVKYPS